MHLKVLRVGAERASNQRQKSGPELLRIRLAFAELFWCICRALGAAVRKPSIANFFGHKRENSAIEP
jgi:hypothetical protein